MMKATVLNTLGIFFLITAACVYGTVRENHFQRAAHLKMTGNAEIRFSRTRYSTNFKTISSLDESQIQNQLKSVHQIKEQISPTVISNTGEIMFTLAKSIDNELVIVVFKNQQIQMIQKVTEFTDQRIQFQYGQIHFLPATTEKMAYSQNIELEL